MSPEKKRRLNTAPYVGLSPFLRSISRLPLRRKCTKTSSPLLCFNHDNTRKSPPRDLMIQPEEVHEDCDDDSNDDEEECEDYSDQTEEEDGELDGKIVHLDFGYYDPKPADFHGVKLLLRGYLDDKLWDLSGFADLIIEQTTVGTVVKSDDGGDDRDGGRDVEEEGKDDDGLYAVISALNLGRYQSHKSIRDIKEYVLGVCKEEALREKLGLLLGQQAKDVGLLVNERFVNFPDQAVVPLYNGLFDEIGWATEDEPTQERRDSFQFKFYLVITKIYMISEERKSRVSKEKVKVSYKNNRESCQDEPVVYIKAEDEIFHKLSFISFTYQMHKENSVPLEMKNYRKMGLIMVMESKEVPNFQKNLNALAEP